MSYFCVPKQAYILMKPLVTSLFIVFSFCSAFGQLGKTIHQTFEVGESKSIALQVLGDVTIVPWAGNTIMTETKVELYDASPSILKHFLEVERRYEIEASDSTANLQLRSFDQERKEIRTRNGVCPEIVHVKIFVPEEFVKQDEQTLVRAD